MSETTRTVVGIQLTLTDKGWAAPNPRFIFHKTDTGWVVADASSRPWMHPLMSYGCGHATLAQAVREAKELLVLVGGDD
jgi:hypothetical protein